MTLAQKNNNPGNLRYAGQREAVGQDDRGFAKFATPWAGWRALIAQIRLDQRRGLTVRQFVYKYAPPSENDSAAYLEFVCDNLNTWEDQLLSEISPFALAGVIAAREGYFATD